MTPTPRPRPRHWPNATQRDASSTYAIGAGKTPAFEPGAHHRFATCHTTGQNFRWDSTKGQSRKETWTRNGGLKMRLFLSASAY
jgi:hypothetical protein